MENIIKVHTEQKERREKTPMEVVNVKKKQSKESKGKGAN